MAAMSIEGASEDDETTFASEEPLRREVERVVGQLSAALEAGSAVRIHDVSDDVTVGKLVTMINFALSHGNASVGQLEDANRSLDETVRRRTAELEHARVVAEHASRAKSDFLARMSHELRTPLNAIIGFAQLLLESEKEPISTRQRRQVSHILTGGRHLLGLIGDVLDLSNIEAGRMELEIKAVDPRALILESQQMVLPSFRTRDVRFECRLDAETDLPPVACDFRRAAQCLINLMSNAFKYNKPGGAVWVNANVVDGERVRFTVCDTGLGVPQDRQHEMFRAFSRLGRETSEIEGAGVGLALSRMLVHAMDGTIDFESVPGEGSTFWFELPIAVTEVEKRARDDGGVDAALGEDLIGRILYVESSTSNIRLMQDILDGYDRLSMMTATTGEEATRLVEQEFPDLIITDINLSAMSGIDLARYVRSIDEIKDIPIFALSADARPETQRRCEAAGMTAFFAKPVVVSEIIEAISSALPSSQVEHRD